MRRCRIGNEPQSTNDDDYTNFAMAILFYFFVFVSPLDLVKRGLRQPDCQHRSTHRYRRWTFHWANSVCLQINGKITKQKNGKMFNGKGKKHAMEIKATNDKVMNERPC